MADIERWAKLPVGKVITVGGKKVNITKEGCEI